MNHRVITFDDIAAIIRRHAWRCLVPAIIAAGGALFIAGLIPPKYKSKALVTIQSSYFRNPLVSDLVPEVTDTAELSAQRQALFRLALDDDFLDSLGEEFDIYKRAAGSPERAEERSLFLKQIEYFAVNPTTFQVSALGPSGAGAAAMLRAVLKKLTETLVEERFNLLMKARDAIAAQVKFLARTLRELNGANPNFQPDYLEGELKRIDEQIAALRERFTESHPEIFRLKGKEAAIKGALARVRRGALDADDPAAAFMTPSSKAPVQDIYNDLLKKLSHLTIVVSMERDRANASYVAVLENPSVPLAPFSPNKLIFLACGAVLGFGFGCMGALYRELRRLAELEPFAAAEALGVPFLGELPRLDRGAAPKLPALDGPSGLPKLLPGAR